MPMVAEPHRSPPTKGPPAPRTGGAAVPAPPPAGPTPHPARVPGDPRQLLTCARLSPPGRRPFNSRHAPIGRAECLSALPARLLAVSVRRFPPPAPPLAAPTRQAGRNPPTYAGNAATPGPAGPPPCAAPRQHWLQRLLVFLVPAVSFRWRGWRRLTEEPDGAVPPALSEGAVRAGGPFSAAASKRGRSSVCRRSGPCLRERVGPAGLSAAA
ncbi:PREDICTED: predicted GPI-anchored protein 58 [Calidris pugnax]|uniref:predicted GPI-anchored protein 58 n=1 Tax=Calidris pugnax TaxID=198806 RepID=UPI00071D8273|nr:PREDICTED: predicted GPI-anchored protein 58 [Calidris pugnax]